MRFATSLLAITLCVTIVCRAQAPSAPPDPSGKTITLRVGEHADVAGLRIGVDGVERDSRCPKGEQCVWAGDAIVHVWLQSGADAKQLRVLHASAIGSRTSDTVSGATRDVPALRLLRLDPMPVTRRTIAPGDYVVTLAIDPLDSGISDR